MELLFEENSVSICLRNAFLSVVFFFLKKNSFCFSFYIYVFIYFGYQEKKRNQESSERSFIHEIEAVCFIS